MRHLRFHVLAAIALTSTIESTVPSPSACTKAECGPAKAWMPDVADRRAELRDRFERFRMEAETGSRGTTRSQWWRSAAARPSLRIVR